MEAVVLTIHLLLALALIVVVLLQRSEGGGLGMGGGSGGGFLSSRGTANMLTRTTAILAALFFTTSLILSILAGYERKPRTLLEGTPAGTTAPGAPLGGEGGGVLDRLRGGAPQPAQPPAGPQVPQSK